MTLAILETLFGLGYKLTIEREMMMAKITVTDVATGISFSQMQPIDHHIDDNLDDVVVYCKNRLTEIMVSKPAPVATDDVNTATVGQAMAALSKFPLSHSIVGNCVDENGKWYTYPVYIAKVPGNNNMVTMQLRPVSD